MSQNNTVSKVKGFFTGIFNPSTKSDSILANHIDSHKTFYYYGDLYLISLNHYDYGHISRVFPVRNYLREMLER
jgi:hypothetical protein